jgi:two-component system chemotaxis response regulator CheY
MMATVPYAGLRVLIVEDEQYTRQIIRTLLLQIGIRDLYEAAEGGAGLRELLRVRPHVVLCDIHMEPMGGLELLKRVRTAKLADIAKTPIVLLTADAKSDTVAIARESGASGYLVKPVSATQLKQRIDHIIGGAG